MVRFLHTPKKIEALSQKRIVFIFDECHRSQFGENHKAIKDFFFFKDGRTREAEELGIWNAKYQQTERL